MVDLKREVATMWGMKKVIVIPVVIGALGAVSKDFEKWIGKIEIDLRVGHVQKTALLHSKNIEEGIRNLKKMDIDFETFSCLLQLAFKA